MHIGVLIKQFHINQNCSVNKLANMAGISQSYLREIELEHKNPTANTLSYICEALNISLADFFTVYCDQESSVSSLMKKIYRLTPQQRKLLESFLHSIVSNEKKNPGI